MWGGAVKSAPAVVGEGAGGGGRASPAGTASGEEGAGGARTIRRWR